MDKETRQTIAKGLMWVALALVILVTYFQVQDIADQAMKPMIWASMIIAMGSLAAGLLTKQ